MGRSANGKGHFWAIHPANLSDFQRGDFRRKKAQKRIKKHMGLIDNDDDEDDELLLDGEQQVASDEDEGTKTLSGKSSIAMSPSERLNEILMMQQKQVNVDPQSAQINPATIAAQLAMRLSNPYLMMNSSITTMTNTPSNTILSEHCNHQQLQLQQQQQQPQPQQRQQSRPSLSPAPVSTSEKTMDHLSVDIANKINPLKRTSSDSASCSPTISIDNETSASVETNITTTTSNNNIKKQRRIFDIDSLLASSS